MSTTEAAAVVGEGVSWADCVGNASWITEPLKSGLNYPNPLPVQQAVIPVVARAMLSGVPMDVSLTAPTGSGKTLCYLLPMMRLITAEKKGLNDTRLRALVLVPTRALGQQVFREVSRLVRHTTISVASLCGDTESRVEEAELLVRRVRAAAAAAAAATVNDPESELLADDDLFLTGEAEELIDGSEGQQQQLPLSGSGYGIHNNNINSSQRYHYFSKVDILVATPQRLLWHLDSTAGLSLASLRLLVIDEADQVLAGNFANFVVKVVERFEEEQAAIAQQEQASKLVSSFSSYSHMSSSSSSSSLKAVLPAQLATLRDAAGNNSSSHVSNGAESVSAAAAAGSATLHKMLCSATLSSRIGRISEVRLRNCQHFALDTNGEVVPEEGTVTTLAASPFGSSGAAAAKTQVVRTAFALPPTLQEHIVFVEDRYRHAVLLKLVRALRVQIEKQQATRLAMLRSLKAEANGEADGDDETKETDIEEKKEEEEEKEKVESKRRRGHAHAAYPTADDDAGTGILVFCSSAEEARVMGHFLSAAGVCGVVEFTTLTTESERRRALLQQPSSTTSNSHNNSNTRTATVCNVVVASDALMRGIDIPNTGHVIMYHPPSSISQYVHRAGRTARAMRPGHLHVLLSKLGPSRTQEDGEVAAFKQLSGLVLRTQPQRYERHFFLFAAAPAPSPAAAAAAGKNATDAKKRRVEPVVAQEKEEKVETEETDPTSAPEATAETPEASEAAAEVAAAVAVSSVTVDAKDAAEWWIAEANRFLAKSQQQLNVKWASVAEVESSAERRAQRAAEKNNGVKAGSKRERSTSPNK